MRYFFPLSPYNQQRQFEKPVWVYPAHLAMYATYLRDNGHKVYWDQDQSSLPHWVDQGKVIENDFKIDVPFEELPYPDRIFTDAKNRRWQAYGNYKLHPATHMMVSNLCWYGKCVFCVDTAKLQAGEKRGVRSVDHVMREIDSLISMGFREVFDDSGTFPVGPWLEEFCAKMQERPRLAVCRKGSRKDLITIGCNMKPIRLDYRMMKAAGFRFILVGVESANQHTIDRIQKGQRAEEVPAILKTMNDAGLEVHLTSMFGYDWETHEDAMRTVRMVQGLLKTGVVKTAQASVYSPPRTMPDPESKGHRYVPMIYDAYRSPRFWFHKIADIRRWEDFTYIMRGGRLVAEEKWRKFWTKSTR